MKTEIILVIVAITMASVIVGGIITIESDPKVIERKASVKEAMIYGCGGTAYDVKNCKMINDKLDRLLVLLEKDQ
jgi:hypothetical protein